MFSRHSFKRTSLEFSKAILLVLIIVSILPWSIAGGERWNPGGSPHPYLAPKWVGFVAGGGLALVTADVLPQYVGEEVFHAGGNGILGDVTCLNGQTGNCIWKRSIYGIGATASVHMADVDNDGKLEIAVTLQHPAGLYILNAEDGSTLWCAPGNYAGNLGYFTPVGGRIDGNIVVGDTDSDGCQDIFVGVMAFLEEPNTGKILHYEWDTANGTIVERGRVQVWHPCAGGLSLGDTDNDGVFELYTNDRSPYAGDGGWGKGLMSFWAENLTMRWTLYDWEASSEIPMLADVDKDGITDVVSANLMTGICVLNSTDGYPLRNTEGTILYDRGLEVIHNHFQASVYDFDGDGNLELLCADGERVSGTQVWDLWNWSLDANISSGFSYRGPSIGEVTGDGIMDMIVVTFDPSLADNGTVQIYDQSYQLVDSFSGLAHRAIGSVVQDIDRDDGGLNELLILTQDGKIYCFDTPGLSQEILGQPRARSEIYFYSESRLGVSEYVPYERPWPDVISPSPVSGATNVTGLAQISFKLNHPLNETMSYTVTSTPNIGSTSGTITGTGVVTIPVDGITASTTYNWHVSVNDTSGHLTNKNYCFTTFPVFGNIAPSQDTPILNSTNSGDVDADYLACYNQTTTDFEGDNVTNICNWLKNNVPIANLVLPFDTKPNPNMVYSATATTRDYSGWGNDGTIFGASWTKGVVGGAFSFDGNDFIEIEEHSNSLDGGGSWSSISIEFWIKANYGGNNTLIWKPMRYDASTRAYEVGFQYNWEQLSFTWGVNTDDAGYNKVSYKTTEALTDWHHVVCTYKSGVGLIIYFDGVQAAANLNTAITGNILDTDGPLEIVARIRYNFDGILDEIRLYPSQVSGPFVNRRYHDTRDGLAVMSSIPISDTVVGEVWTCQVTPNDGFLDGQTIVSNPLTITNVMTGELYLRIGVIGSGSTIDSGICLRDIGADVSVLAMANTGWRFDHWILNNTNVGNANPYSLTMNYNYDLTAIFTTIPGTYLFTDGFESGSGAWTGTTTTPGSSASVVSDISLIGNYSGRYNVNSGTGTRRAYSYVGLPGLAEVTAYANVYIADGLSLADGQNMWLIQFVDSSSSVMVSFGLRAESSGTRWAMQYGDGATVASAPSSVPLPVEGQWYLIEAYYVQASTGKTVKLTVNGVEAVSLAVDATGDKSLVEIRFGIDYYTSNSAATLYIDDVTIDSTTQQTWHTLSVQISGSGVAKVTNGKSVSEGIVSARLRYSEGTILSVDALQSQGWRLSYWLLDDQNIGSANPCTLAMDSGHSLTAVFEEIPLSALLGSLGTLPLIAALALGAIAVAYYLTRRLRPVQMSS